MSSVVLQISFISYFENKPQFFPDTQKLQKSGCFHTVLNVDTQHCDILGRN